MSADNKECVFEYPLQKVKDLSDSQMKRLLVDMQDFCLYHGNLMKIHTDPNKERFKAHMSSTTLVPSCFSRKAYEHALRIQPLYNILYHKIAMDREFLLSTLCRVAECDDFMKRHLDIYNKLHEENVIQCVHLGLMRSDYMCHIDEHTIKQVEINTMSAAASGVCRAATKWHRYVTGTLLGLDSSKIPENNATSLLAKAIATAWTLYGNDSAAVVFFVGKSEFNFADQRSLQYEIEAINSKIRVLRVTFDDLTESMLVDYSRTLYINQTEVAVFYYRYGYSPSHYTSDDFWNLRLNVERSRAIKCPSINYVLAGTKRVQQAISRPGMLERWLDAESSEIIRETFMGLYSFEAGEVSESIKRATSEPKKYILKPQRDGGGNNFYHEDMLDKIATTKQEELAAFTLMEKIFPPEQENCLVNGVKEPSFCDLVSELGIFGAIIVDEPGNVLMNDGAGFLLRSKQSTKTEGDLMRGTSSLDSPWFCDDLTCLNLTKPS